MLKTITLKCSSCGGNLEITPEMDNFACGYCGVSQIVQRRGGTISLKLLTDSISKVQIGTDKTAAELAIKRLGKEIVSAQENYSQTFMAQRRETENNVKGFLIIGALSALILFGWIASVSAFLAAVVTLSGIVGAIYFGYKRNESIRAKYKPKLEELDCQYKLLNKKMAQHRAIVD